MNFPDKEARCLNKSCVKFLAKCKKKVLERTEIYLKQSARKSQNREIKWLFKILGNAFCIYKCLIVVEEFQFDAKTTCLPLLFCH